MRRTLVFRYLRILAIFLAGALAGRFLVPLLEPHEVHHVAVGAEAGVNTCSLILEHITTVMGRTTRLVDELDVLKCSESRDFTDTSIHCRCPRPRASPE